MAYEPVAQTTQPCLYLAVPGNSPFKTFDDLSPTPRHIPAS
jgi:hypothetical protein